MSVLAKTTLVGRRGEEPPFDIEVLIGTPYRVDEHEEWACPVGLSPLHSRLPDAHGVDSFQALCLATGLVFQLLEAFRERGGTLSFPSGEEFPLDTYASSHAKGLLGDSGPIERDDGVRGSHGVICSLHEIQDGRLRVVLDDVENTSDHSRGPWQHRTLFTWKDYEADDLDSPEMLSDAETAAFGFHVLARLLALTKTRG